MVRSMDRFFHRKSSASAQESGSATVQTRADQGDADAQFSLGLRYGSAAGDALDFAQAARWYRKAADQDYPLAQYNLGVMFARGQGVPQDDAASAGWIRRAAEGGDAGGQYDLGVLCHRASVDPQRVGKVESRIEAYMWLHLAAAQGYKDSAAAWERLTITMTRAEVVEGNRRAAAFVAREPANPQIP
jgi:TPR repeat protein